jgi:hypothetical protein
MLAARRSSIIHAMDVAVKAVLVLLCAVALGLVALKFILPLGALYISGGGVETPLPKWLVLAHPKLAIYLFNLGGPLLFIALLATEVWLLRLLISPR